MSLTRKTSSIDVIKSGNIPSLPDEMASSVENTNWWFEVRSVINRQKDEIDQDMLPVNHSFSTETVAPFGYNHTHGTGRYPIVQVLDEDNKVINTTITHNSVNDFTVNHTEALTGTLIIR